MERILIAGGMGFIGKNLVLQFQDLYEIIILDKFEDPNFQLNPNSSFIKFDFDYGNLNNIIKNIQPDYIINLISLVTAERDLSLFEPMINSNLVILLKFYEACLGYSGLKLFLQFGTGEEYGNITPPFSENDRECPVSPYAITKQLTTNSSIMLFKNYNFPIAIVRLGNIFGNFQNENKFIPYIIKMLKNNKPLHLSPCDQKRDFIDVETLSYLISQLIKNYKHILGEIINVSSGKSFSLKEIISFCQKKLCSNSEIIYGAIPYRENEMMDFRLNIIKLVNLLNLDTNFYNLYKKLDEYIQNYQIKKERG